MKVKLYGLACGLRVYNNGFRLSLIRVTGFGFGAKHEELRAKGLQARNTLGSLGLGPCM